MTKDVPRSESIEALLKEAKPDQIVQLAGIPRGVDIVENPTDRSLIMHLDDGKRLLYAERDFRQIYSGDSIASTELLLSFLDALGQANRKVFAKGRFFDDDGYRGLVIDTLHTPDYQFRFSNAAVVE